MIISKTPLRMSFVGGGSDLPAYYQQFGGAVISTAINHFVYVNVNPKFDQDGRTAKLAALAMMYFLTGVANR